MGIDRITTIWIEFYNNKHLWFTSICFGLPSKSNCLMLMTKFDIGANTMGEVARCLGWRNDHIFICSFLCLDLNTKVITPWTHTLCCTLLFWILWGTKWGSTVDNSWCSRAQLILCVRWPLQNIYGYQWI